MHTARTRNLGCIRAALKIIGDKWTALILYELSGTPLRFTQIEHLLPGISPRTLSQRLAMLESAGVIQKRDVQAPAACTQYCLTPKGTDFAGILKQMADWGSKYPDETSR